jgi:hypothetical protein
MGLRKNIRRLRVVVLEPADDLLARTSLLHAAFLKAVAGCRIKELVETDLAKGCIEVIVEGGPIHPETLSGAVRVEITPVS